MFDIDIIIPAYNSCHTIDIPLRSIAIQKTKYKFRVVIVNDKSDYSYSEFVNKYAKYFDICELSLIENSGPGVARQKGIDYTSSKYIMFIDSDDYLYTPYSIDKLMDTIIDNNTDLVVGNVILEKYGKREIIKQDNVWMHGKIYKREFLEKNDVHFNLSRLNEDNGFNRLVFLLTSSISYLDEVVYVYKDNEESLTRKNNGLYRYTGLEDYAYNMEWAFKEAKKRLVEEKKIMFHALSILISSYYYYCDLKEKYDVSKILKWFKNINDLIDISSFSKEDIDYLLEINKTVIDDLSKCDITFNEYLKLLEEYHD